MIQHDSLINNQLKEYLETVAVYPGGRAKVVGLAARAALRGIPQLARLEFDGKSKKSEILLAAFRAASAAWAASIYPDSALKIGSAVFNAPSKARDLLKTIEPSSTSVVRSINLLADAGSATRTQNNPSGYAALVQSGATVVEQAALAADLETFDRGFDPLRQPIWLVDRPDSDLSNWLELKKWMQSSEDKWDVWVHWFEARLAGRTVYPQISGDANSRIEVARILELKTRD